MNIPVSALVLIVSVLMLVVTLTEPLARRLRLPPGVLLALIGVAVGLFASWALFGGMVDEDNAFVRFFADPPVSSAIFIYVFLPTLLFQSALGIDVSEVAADAVPILMLAVIAVITATLAIGFALWPFAGVSVFGCLLLGAIVATTDPVAVIGIFREVGAPERLVRLVEGESLLNDAAAVTMFVVFTALIVQPGALGEADVAIDFLIIPFGGVVVGWICGRAAAALIGIFRDGPHGAISISLALPYFAYVVAEETFHLSGVIAVVVAGLTFAREGPPRMAPDNWRTLREVWAQLDHWASTLLFLLASVLVPRLLAGATTFDVVLLAIVVLAATAARALIVHGILPLLEWSGLSPPVSGPHKAVILWGGLRGATTLALALAVTENPVMPEPVSRLIAVLATGYALFTLIVQGITLRPLMKHLGLDRLTPVDEVVRDASLAVAYGRVADRLAGSARRYGLSEPAADAVVSDVRRTWRAADEAARVRPGLMPEDRVALALVAASRREHDYVLEHGASGVVPPALVAPLVAHTRSLVDGARLGGEAGWQEAADTLLEFDWRDKLAHALYRRFAIEGPLARRIERRFSLLLATRILLADVRDFAREEVAPLAGADAGNVVEAALARRAAAVERAIEALHLQYPDYAERLQESFMRDIALALERGEVDSIGETGLVNAEVGREIVRRVEERRHTIDAKPKLDLGLDTLTLVSGTPLFAVLPAKEREGMAAMLKPVFAYPGEVMMRRGEKGDAAYFISSGAVEVDTGNARFMLGRGGVFGEMSLITGRPRSGTVTAATYSRFLRLSKRDFDAFMTTRPDVRAHVEALAAERARVNAAAEAEPQLSEEALGRRS